MTVIGKLLRDRVGVVYILDSEQPPTCPKCGARTDWNELEDGSQLHQCLDNSCSLVFIGEFDAEDEDIHPLALNGALVTDAS